jgi:hypothetical protein
MSIKKEKTEGRWHKQGANGEAAGGRVNWRGVLLCPTSNVHPKKSSFHA